MKKKFKEKQYKANFLKFMSPDFRAEFVGR